MIWDSRRGFLVFALVYAVGSACCFAIASAQETKNNVETPPKIWLCSIKVGDKLMAPTMFGGNAGICRFVKKMDAAKVKVDMVCFDIENPDASEVSGTASGLRGFMQCDTHEEGKVKGL